MRKFFFFVLMLFSVVGIVSFVLFPVYKYDNDQITKYNTEYVLALSGVDLKDFYNTYDSLSSDEKKQVKAQVKDLKTKVYAIRTKDYETLYSSIDYIVINDIYKEQYSKDAFSRDENGELIKPSEETKNAIVKALTDALGEEEFNTKKQENLDKFINDFNSKIDDGKYKDTIIEDGKLKVSDDLFLIFSGMDKDLIETTTKEINEKGLFIIQIFRGLEIGFKIDHQVWQKEAYKGMNLFQKTSAVFKDEEFYNPFPLLLLIFIYFYLIISLLCMFFKAIKGLRGKKRPKLFIFSIINFALCCLLIFAKDILPLSYINSYHGFEYQRLLDFIMFGKAEIAIYIVGVIFGFTFILSIMQLFFKFGKHRKVAKDEE